MKPVIKWSGSKRSQASKIKSFFPETFGTYFEPFIGGGSMLYAINPSKSICGDICASLIDLWNEIKEHPVQLATEYEIRWSRLQNEGYTAYYEIRDIGDAFTLNDVITMNPICIHKSTPIMLVYR